jgi:peptidase S41-like protein
MKPTNLSATARHEWFLPLWIDLLLDFVCSPPRQHLRFAPSASRATAPAFVMLEGEAPRPEPFLLGLVASLILILATIPTGRFLASRPVAHFRPRTLMQVAAQSPAPQPLTAADRHRLIQAIADRVRRHYFDKKIAEATAAALLAHERAGDYNAMTEGQVFANLIVRHLAEASRDNHFTMEYTRGKFPDFSKAPSPPPEAQAREAQARYRTEMEQSNCTFEKIEMRANRVGYVKFNFFPELTVCQSKAESAMAALNRADALIIDLRDNRGGQPEMVMFVAGYFFDHPEYMYSPRDRSPTEKNWTRSPVAGNLLADKPVYILASSRTFSGAEQFIYDMKMLKRATLIGETTGGGTHSGALFNLDHHFAIGIPEYRPLNPFSNKDWGMTGVEPDVKTKAADALATAEKLVEAKLHKR